MLFAESLSDPSPCVRQSCGVIYVERLGLACKFTNNHKNRHFFYYLCMAFEMRQSNRSSKDKANWASLPSHLHKRPHCQFSSPSSRVNSSSRYFHIAILAAGSYQKHLIDYPRHFVRNRIINHSSISRYLFEAGKTFRSCYPQELHEIQPCQLKSLRWLCPLHLSCVLQPETFTQRSRVLCSISGSSRPTN